MCEISQWCTLLISLTTPLHRSIVMNVRRAVERLAERELLPRWTTFKQDEERIVAWRLVLDRILLTLNVRSSGSVRQSLTALILA